MGKKWDEQRINEYLNEYNYKLLRMVEFKGEKSLIEIECSNNHKFIIKFSSFKKRAINGKNTLNKCEFCYKDFRKQLVLDRCKKLNYIVEDFEYTDRSMVLNIICDKGHEWHPTYENFVRNKAICLTCTNIMFGENQRLPWNEVLKRVEINGYKVLSDESDYENNESKLKVECPKGHMFYVALNNFQQGKRCPYCNMSSGEQEVERLLIEYNIKHETQYTFKDCKNIKELPFDFYLPDYNILIEYDGEQHYGLRFEDTIEDFIKRKINDGLKNEYCYFNNIPLIRIPYWKFNNIENILCKELNLI